MMRRIEGANDPTGTGRISHDDKKGRDPRALNNSALSARISII